VKKSFSASGGFAPDPLTSTPEIARVTKTEEFVAQDRQGELNDGDL